MLFMLVCIQTFCVSLFIGHVIHKNVRGCCLSNGEKMGFQSKLEPVDGREGEEWGNELCQC